MGGRLASSKLRLTIAVATIGAAGLALAGAVAESGREVVRQPVKVATAQLAQAPIPPSPFFTPPALTPMPANPDAGAEAIARAVGPAAPPPAAAYAPASDPYGLDAAAQDLQDFDEGSGIREATFRLIAPGARKAGPRDPRGSLKILQIGDSHTAADYFTGEARRILQARFGNGGAGYLEVGKPNPGVRSSVMSMSASPGWSYAALQRSTDTRPFYLSGFNATASHAGEALSFSSETAIPFDLVEIEVLVGPHNGGIEIRLDDLPPVRRSLSAERPDRIVLRTTTEGKAPLGLRRLSITTTDDQPVTISSVGIFNTTRGVSYSQVGFPGATVDIVNKLDPRIFADDLKRLSPQIVVLAFGTNEGFNDNLDLTEYSSRYLAVINKIRAVLPDARIVMIAPPHANRVPASCLKDPTGDQCKPVTDEARDCGYATPPNLDRVRARLGEIARQENLPLWDWSLIMPSRCGPKQWIAATPKLMTGDHVHFTKAGYELSARSFAKFLESTVSQFRQARYALSDH